MDQFVGQTLPFRGDNSGDYVYQTHLPARQHGFEGGAGYFAQTAVRLGVTETLTVPVFVENRLWGAIVVLTSSRRLPSNAESRLGQFGDLSPPRSGT